MTDEKIRRRWINLGEVIALAALIVSAFGVWIAWKSSSKDGPTRIVEQKSAVPLALRGSVDSSGQTLTIIPADPGHARRHPQQIAIVPRRGPGLGRPRHRRRHRVL